MAVILFIQKYSFYKLFQGGGGGVDEHPQHLTTISLELCIKIYN